MMNVLYANLFEEIREFLGIINHLLIGRGYKTFMNAFVIIIECFHRTQSSFSENFTKKFFSNRFLIQYLQDIVQPNHFNVS